MPEATPQELADSINLGAHQTVLEAADENGQTQRFVVHRPTLRDQLKIGVTISALVSSPTTVQDGQVQVGAPVAVAEPFMNVADAVATLNVVVDHRPAGIAADVGDWTDMALAGNLFTAFGEWLDHFRGPVLPAGGADRGTPEPTAPRVVV